jgi:hypothetical protein
MAPDDPQDSPAVAALMAIGRDAPQPHTTAELDQGLRAVRARFAADRQRRRRRVRRSLLAATAAICVVVAVKLMPVSRTDTLARETPVSVSRIEGGTILEGGYLTGRAAIKVFFNEGSTFHLTSGTRGRVREVANDQVRLAIEHGTGAFQITRSRERRWLIEAGPFVVTVRGTAFTVSWEPTSERFELRLREGHVVVSGPTVGKAMALSAGERLVVSLPKAEAVITEGLPEDAGQPAEAEVIAGPVMGVSRAALNKPTARPAVTAGPPSKTAGPRRWVAQLASGRWDEILADVDRDGVDATLEGAASDELLALADAARYRRRTELAQAALLAHRRRFPGSPRSLDAMFLLGRVEELRDQAEDRAIAWYDAYLARAPAGAYAAEALGRKMVLINETRGAALARPIADAYLRRFPNGSYAASARALQHSP